MNYFISFTIYKGDESLSTWICIATLNTLVTYVVVDDNSSDVSAHTVVIVNGDVALMDILLILDWFYNWVSIHLRHSLSSCQTSNSCQV